MFTRLVFVLILVTATSVARPAAAQGGVDPAAWAAYQAAKARVIELMTQELALGKDIGRNLHVLRTSTSAPARQAAANALARLGPQHIAVQVERTAAQGVLHRAMGVVGRVLSGVAMYACVFTSIGGTADAAEIDWRDRPTTPEQCVYAEADVEALKYEIHLVETEIAEVQRKIAENNRLYTSGNRIRDIWETFDAQYRAELAALQGRLQELQAALERAEEEFERCLDRMIILEDICDPLPACDDSEALNHNPGAGADDGNICAHNYCTDESAVNAWQPGTCEYYALGCTDESATNHDPDAEMDDGSCAYDSGDMDYGYTDYGDTDYGDTDYGYY